MKPRQGPTLPRMHNIGKFKKARTGKNGVQRLTTEELRFKILEMRRTGMYQHEIAKKLGVTQPCVCNHINAYIRDLHAQCREDAKVIMELEVQRLDGLLASLWPKRKDPRTADTILRLCARRSALLGLDAPTNQNVKVEGLESLSDEQITAKLEAIIHAARTRGDGFPDGGAEAKAEAEVPG